MYDWTIVFHRKLCAPDLVDTISCGHGLPEALLSTVIEINLGNASGLFQLECHAN